MNELYNEVSSYFRPITAEHICLINKIYSEEDRFNQPKDVLGKVESKLYNIYHYKFLETVNSIVHFELEKLKNEIIRIASLITWHIAGSQIFPTANKRTAATSADIFLHSNSFRLIYAKSSEIKENEFVSLILDIGAGKINQHKAEKWFQNHVIITEG